MDEVATVDNEVSTWSAGIAALSGAEAEAHSKAVVRRRESNAALRAATERSGNPDYVRCSPFATEVVRRCTMSRCARKRHMHRSNWQTRS